MSSESELTPEWACRETAAVADSIFESVEAVRVLMPQLPDVKASQRRAVGRYDADAPGFHNGLFRRDG